MLEMIDSRQPLVLVSREKNRKASIFQPGEPHWQDAHEQPLLLLRQYQRVTEVRYMDIGTLMPFGSTSEMFDTSSP